MTALESFAGGREIPVDFTAIERELAALWKTASAAPAGPGAPALMRACQLNLVVLCRGGAEAAGAGGIVTEVTRQRPSRVLMAVVEPDAAGERLDASITAHCSFVPGFGGRHVCCEQITLVASRAGARRLPGAVLPLLLPDLPVVMWRPGAPDAGWMDPGDPLAGVLDRLLEAADRIVIDTRRLLDPAAGTRRLASLPCAITDLSWRGMRSWRELAAGMFDGPAMESWPKRIDRITLEYAFGGGDPSREPAAARMPAILLGCWAASRLKWEPAPAAGEDSAQEAERFDLWRPDGAPARLILRRIPAGDEPEPGRILSVTLEGPEASFTLRRAPGADRVTSSVTLPGTCPVPLTARVVDRDETALLSRALEVGGRDTIYHETLQLAARLLAVRKWEAAA